MTVSTIHLVGSIPFANSTEVFTTASKILPGRLKRLPDGETGERHYFVRWQGKILAKTPEVFEGSLRKKLGFEPVEEPVLSKEERERVLVELARNLEVTGYETAALKSYEELKGLKKEGVIEKNVRFLVSLPTPCSVTGCFVRSDLRAEVEVLYEEAILRSLKKVEAGIPAKELSVQWDAPVEMNILEGADRWGRVRDFPWWSEGKMEGVVDRLSRLVGSVSEGVEVGLHLCYGDSGNVHFCEPRDMALMVEVAKGVNEKGHRPLHFLHMPVPKERKDVEYFKPLNGLKKYLDAGMELSLGLVHGNDLKGTKERMKAARDVVPVFSASTECGLGRGTAEDAKIVLETCAAISRAKL